MVKKFVTISILLTIIISIGCVESRNKGSDISSIKVSDYTNTTESFKVETGLIRFDTLPKNLKAYQLDSGGYKVFVYERTGITMLDAEDWEAKYTETLIFQIDSTIREFEYCDSDLNQIDCKYYWICLAKDIKKEIIDIDEGCINGYLSKDSIVIDINVNSGFSFGGYMEKENDRVVNYKTTWR